MSPTDSDDFDEFVETYRQASAAIVTGDSRPVLELFSEHDDVTLANPLGPPRRGRAEVEKATSAAAANFTGGSGWFEEVSSYHTADLGYTVELEHFDVQLAGSEKPASTTLRVTTVFRRETDSWKVVHRHADPITTARAVETILDA